MTDDWVNQLATRLNRSATDPLIARLSAFVTEIEAGDITLDQAEARLSRDPELRPLIDLQEAEVGGGVTIGDVAGKNMVKITVSVALPPAPPPDPLIAAREKLQALPLDTIPEPAPLPQPFRMPLSRNSQFVGREHDLQHLARALKGGATAAIGQVEMAAATGMGGIGKTQLASEFVHRYGQYFLGGVFWLSFADPKSVPAEIAACGGVGSMDLPGFNTLALAAQVAKVRQTWGEALPRLLVFDNCEDGALLDEWRPTTGGAHVLLTSRRAQWSQLPDVEAVALGVLQRHESLVLLHQHRPDLEPNDLGLDAVAAELGDLPLALHLAGSYLEQYKQRMSPDQYVVQLRTPTVLQHRSLQRSGLSPTKHVLDVNRTFAVSYETLKPDEEVDALALAFLARATCFAPGEAIPRDLLLQTLEQASDDLDAQLLADDALTRLVDIGLLESEAKGALRIHRLVVAFVHAVQADALAQAAVERVMIAIASRFNNEGYPASLLELQAHLRAITDEAQKRDDELAAELCNTFGYHLHMIGDYMAARPYFERALAINQQVLGASHPDTALSLNNLGFLLQDQGDYVGARPYYERALAIREQVQGANHPDTANSLNNLGALLHAQGDYVGARPYYERALAICEQRLGPSHPTTQAIRNNLAVLAQEMEAGKSEGSRYLALAARLGEIRALLEKAEQQ